MRTFYLVLMPECPEIKLYQYITEKTQTLNT